MMVIVIRSLAAMIIGAHLLLPGITDYVPTITVLIHFILPLSPFSSENIAVSLFVDIMAELPYQTARSK